MRYAARVAGLLLLATSASAQRSVEGVPDKAFCAYHQWEKNCSTEAECSRYIAQHMCDKHGGPCPYGSGGGARVSKTPVATATLFAVGGGVTGYILGGATTTEDFEPIPGMASAGAQAGAGSMLWLAAVGTAPKAHPVETVIYSTAGAALAARGIAEIQNKKNGKDYDVDKSTMIGGAVGALTGFALAPLSSGSKLRVFAKPERAWAPILDARTWGLSIRW